MRGVPAASGATLCCRTHGGPRSRHACVCPRRGSGHLPALRVEVLHPVVHEWPPRVPRRGGDGLRATRRARRSSGCNPPLRLSAPPARGPASRGAGSRSGASSRCSSVRNDASSWRVSSSRGSVCCSSPISSTSARTVRRHCRAPLGPGRRDGHTSACRSRRGGHGKVSSHHLRYRALVVKSRADGQAVSFQSFR